MIYLGSDHRGFKTKEAIKNFLSDENIEYVDCGTETEERADYPKFAKKVAQSVKRSKENKGILICGTGIGMSIVANKFKGIRCALCYNTEAAKLSRMHNDSNILALCANDTEIKDSIEIVKEWLNAEFMGDRHQDRIEMINEIENENFK